MPDAHDQRPPIRTLRTILLVLAVANVLGCAGGAGGIAIAGPSFFGTDLLAGTPFEGRYWLAVLLLGGVVGGTQLVAAVVTLLKSAWYPFFHLVAGVTMVCWIYGEVTVIGGGAWLQHIYFVLGLLQIGLVTLLLGVIPTRDAPRGADPTRS
ncbi:hypothetical protein GCM10009785_06860 [Brooklawnia cerclae]|uniref:Uncharacterized protein n=1 Tax=Brooklawnia cerclae TaxID=349934 RepID=A0ABX0SI37_9ACTN|nr:hypothetical protein [Brooklawnia cerclae]NIH56392.1 hypothetical protein [Brooklawnia cerclae]